MAGLCDMDKMCYIYSKYEFSILKRLLIYHYLAGKENNSKDEKKETGMLAKGITWYQKDRSSHLKVKEMVRLSHQIMSVVNLTTEN